MMPSATNNRIAIIGAGLGGSLLACYLGRAGFDVAVYERAPDPRRHGFVGGRSINLALSARGIHALREVGLADEVMKSVIPMPGRMIHAPDGHLAFQPYSANPEDRINSVSRAGLNMILLNAAESYPNVKIMFDHRCVAIDFQKPAIIFEKPGAADRVTFATDRIIGADGAFSAVRLQMMLHMDRFEYRQEYLEHGYKELTIPATAVGEFAMEPHALHIWPRGGYMMIALPNQDRSFTCTCFWPLRGPNGFESIRTDEEILRFFTEHFPDAVPLMPTLVADYKRNPTGSLVTIHCSPWHCSDRALLIGDAAHAIVPFYGQGMNCAFEDCSVLADCIRRLGPDWKKIFESFAAQRKPNADAIAEMALDNFIEMRDKTASRLFRAKKRIEHALQGAFPNWFTPLYDLISFSTMPYAEARRRAMAQSRVLRVIGWSAAGLVVLIAAALVVRFAA